MSDGQDEMEDIVTQLQNLQIRKSELLQRLEHLNEANPNTSETPIATRVLRAFVIGDLVRIKNLRPLQAKQGTITRIGVDTDRITVQTKNGSKIVRASHNLAQPSFFVLFLQMRLRSLHLKLRLTFLMPPLQMMGEPEEWAATSRAALSLIQCGFAIMDSPSRGCLSHFSGSR
jgi:hypothetical protein